LVSDSLNKTNNISSIKWNYNITLTTYNKPSITNKINNIHKINKIIFKLHMEKHMDQLLEKYLLPA